MVIFLSSSSTLLIADARTCPYLPASLKVSPNSLMKQIAGLEGGNCLGACSDAGFRCDQSSFDFVNSCKSLSIFFPCESGCDYNVRFRHCVFERSLHFTICSRWDLTFQTMWATPKTRVIQENAWWPTRSPPAKLRTGRPEDCVPAFHCNNKSLNPNNKRWRPRTIMIPAKAQKEECMKYINLVRRRGVKNRDQKKVEIDSSSRSLKIWN